MPEATYTRSVTLPRWMAGLWSGAGPSELILDGPPDAIGTCRFCFRSSWGRELQVQVNLNDGGRGRVVLDTGFDRATRPEILQGVRRLLEVYAPRLREWLANPAGWEVWQRREVEIAAEARAALFAGRGARALELSASHELRSSRGLLVAIQLAQRCGDSETAVKQLERLPAVFSGRGVLVGAADTARALSSTRHLETLLATSRRLPKTPPYDALRLQLCLHCRDAFAPGSGEDSLEATLRELRSRDRSEATSVLFQLASWRDSAEEMSSWVDELSSPERPRARALVLLAEARYSEAARALAAVVEESPGDEEARQLQAEALARAGEPELACALEVPRPGVGPARTLLSVAIGEPTPRDDPKDTLAALGLDEPVTPEAALRGLKRLGWNRTHTPTTVNAGELRKFSFRSARQKVIAIQHQVTFRTPEQCFALLDELAEREPDNIHVLTYQGELLLWMGEYERAIAHFRESRERFRARWSYIGEGAALSLLHRDDEALAAWDAFEGERLPYTAVYCYRGEIWLRRGELEKARESLEWAAEQTPSRLGVWPALGKLAEATGDDQLAQRALERITTLCPALLAEARPTNGPETSAAGGNLFATLLDMLRGNRSSHVYGFYDVAGSWRAHDAAPSSAADRLNRSIEQL